MVNAAFISFLTEAELLIFYGWWQLLVCLFAFLGLMGIWWHIGRLQGDLGQVWLAGSVLCWSISGGVDVYFGTAWQSLALQTEAVPAIASQEVTLSGIHSILSLFNSLLILLSLPWFRYLPRVLEPLIRSEYWHWIIGLPFVFSFLPTLRRMFGEGMLIGELDVYYSLLTLGFLGLVLWQSFARRRLPSLAWLTVLCIGITVLAQVLKLSGAMSSQLLFSAVFKSALIMLFFALALSWVKELVENVIPSHDQLRLALHRSVQNGKEVRQLTLQGFPGGKERTIQLSPSHYELLLRFAHRRVHDPDGWLEIKPKSESRSGKQYDIQDHNEVKRLMVGILNGLFGKGSWSEQQHFVPLKTTFLESAPDQARKVRLRIPRANISLPTT
ncbi:MAG: hypothetical protein AAGH79_13345 [Bacteroidota bacterium]